MKFFYINSQFNSLKQNILDENAISRLVIDLPLPVSKKKLHLNLNRRAKLKDKHLIFYFSHKEEYQSLFNDVYTQFINESIIYAPIPTNKNIKIKVHYYEKDNSVYVLKVLESTHYKEELSNINKEVIVTHPKKINIEYNKAVKKKKIPVEDADAKKELKTNKTRATNSSINNVEIEDFNSFDLPKDEDNSFYFNLKMKAIKIDKVEKRTKKPKINQKVPSKPMSTRDESNSKGSSIGTELQLDKKIGDFLNYEELIKLLEENSFSVEVYNSTFERIASVLTGNNLTNFTNRANTYVADKATYRSYILLRIERNEQVVFFLDIQVRKKCNDLTGETHELNRNSILVVEESSKLEEFHEKYIGKFIFDFSVSGGAWIKTINRYFFEKKYLLLKHSFDDILLKNINENFKV